MLEEIKNLVKSTNLAMDVQPIDVLLFIPPKSRKKGFEKVAYEKVKIHRVNISNAGEILYLIENSNGTRKYVNESEIKII
jgi:hypothetical protein